MFDMIFCMFDIECIELILEFMFLDFFVLFRNDI